MLQRIARRALKSHHVLVNAGLRKDVLVEEVVVCQATAQVIVVPCDFPVHPRLAFSAESQALFLPLCA